MQDRGPKAESYLLVHEGLQEHTRLVPQVEDEQEVIDIYVSLANGVGRLL